MDKKFQRISFCTVAKNRLIHVKETLSKNIRENIDYPFLEFVLLDYDSNDNLDQWVSNDMLAYIRSRRLVYAKINSRNHFHRSHARNMAFKLSSGDIICNIDADNYTGEGFAFYLNDLFHCNENSFLSVDYNGKRGRDPSVYGRLAVLKNDFIKIGGYDETFLNYGCEDKDIVSRLEMSGLRNLKLENEVYLMAIPHSDEMRLAHECIAGRIDYYFVNQITPERSEIICLFKNGIFERGTLIPSAEKNTFDNLQIVGGKWEKGSWKKSENRFVLTSNCQKTFFFDETRQILVDTSSIPVAIYCKTPNDLMQKRERTHSVITNYQKYLFNRTEKIIDPNNGIFGMGDLQFLHI